MRKLHPIEEVALNVLTERGSICPGLDAKGSSLAHVLDNLVKKKRATVEMTEDGPRYHAAQLLQSY